MTHRQPNPEVRFERYYVDQGGKRYIAEFFNGQPREVQVRMPRNGGRTGSYRTLWYALSNGADVPLRGRAAEVVSYILNPVEAQRCGAGVEDPATRKARMQRTAARIDAEVEAAKKAEAKAKRLADAAPKLLEAAKKAATIMGVDRNRLAQLGKADNDVIGASVLELLKQAIAEAEA